MFRVVVVCVAAGWATVVVCRVVVVVLVAGSVSAQDVKTTVDAAASKLTVRIFFIGV